LGWRASSLDLSELAFFDFAPAVNAGLGFLSFAAFNGARSRWRYPATRLAVRGASEGFDGVAAQKFCAVLIEEIAGAKMSLQPLRRRRPPYADDALILQPEVACEKRRCNFVTKSSMDTPTRADS